MSGELKTQGQTAETVYALLFSGAQVFNTVSGAFEAYSTGSLGSYDIALTEQGSSGRFVGDMPSGVSRGRYDVYFYVKEGASPAELDDFIGNLTLYWSGDAVVDDPGTIDTTVGLITLTEAKEYLKTTNASDDAILSALINGASSWIKGYLGRSLVRTSYVEYYSGDGSDCLLLRNRPIVSVSSIYVDSLRQWASSSLVASTNYIVKKESGILETFQLMSNWSPGSSNIKVSYSAGYTTGSSGTMPHDIRLATKRILEKYYRIGYSHRKLDFSSESIEGMNVSFRDDDVAKDVKLMLSPYRNLLSSPQYDYAD